MTAGHRGAEGGPAAGPARRTARPVPGRRLPGGRLADRLGLPSATLLSLLAERGTAGPARAAAVQEDLLRRRHVLLVTRRADGTEVATPVWAAGRDRRLYVRTQRASWKVGRVLRDGAVRLAPCDFRGRPLAPAVPATCRVLPAGEEAAAERAIARRHGWVRRCCALAQDALRVDMCYLEIVLP